MHHRATSVGFGTNFGTTGYKHLHAIPIIYKSNNSGEIMQYAAVTFYIKKINNAIEENSFKDEFNQQLEYASEEFVQIAFGVKACRDEWGAEHPGEPVWRTKLLDKYSGGSHRRAADAQRMDILSVVQASRAKNHQDCREPFPTMAPTAAQADGRMVADGASAAARRRRDRLDCIWWFFSNHR